MTIFSFKNINPTKHVPYHSPEEEKRHVLVSFFMPFIFVLLAWCVKLIELVLELDLSAYGIFPRKLGGLPGVIASPFLHSDFTHLISNSIPFMILGFLMIYSYRRVAFKAFLMIWIMSGFLVWITGRQSYHIGASNIVYGFTFYIFFSGIFRKNIQSVVLSLFVVFAYGSIFWGILPLRPEISWEGHLAGALIGGVLAFIYRKVDLPPQFLFEEDTDDTLADTDDESIEVNDENTNRRIEK